MNVCAFIYGYLPTFRVTTVGTKQQAKANAVVWVRQNDVASAQNLRQNLLGTSAFSFVNILNDYRLLTGLLLFG